MTILVLVNPKEAPLKGCWVEIVAENWVKEDILYITDNSYSSAYKRNMLIDTYEEARQNLPRAKKGLPILPNDPSQTGRGCRQITLKSRKLPGEATTEQESDVSLNVESYFATTSKSLLKTNTTASKGKGIAKRSAPGPSKISLLPIPPSGPLVSKTIASFMISTKENKTPCREKVPKQKHAEVSPSSNASIIPNTTSDVIFASDLFDEMKHSTRQATSASWPTKNNSHLLDVRACNEKFSSQLLWNCQILL
ncbi:Uncharacterized protein APZ42_031357 [Daphnia magna]|uniref:Uncharacterized protein n=1 Tax=Daphnia magna TaxID=35525 RepID=A0A164MXB5_9CRUS|nr:Uncharacterized protein APZ42_031357 [Daphnia magna]